ncbi:hypothetical protein [Achromobacter insolitus]|uniref:hypothetical protein n=1 Tax=Achromobacter insolitus TaxID=217204 RepID=UPI00174E31AB|nr:hypothetical protein [Achromobacter insolitus]
MNPTTLPVDRIEFTVIKVEANRSFSADKRSKHFPQVDFSFSDSDVRLAQRSFLTVDNQENPRFFALDFGIKLEDAESTDASVPYELEVVVRGYLRYTGSQHVGVDRFRAVRFSGYSILYGAIREMVSNLTGRGPHGILQLPAMNFHELAKADAENDEANRQKVLSELAAKPKPAKKVITKKTTRTLSDETQKKHD